MAVAASGSPTCTCSAQVAEGAVGMDAGADDGAAGCAHARPQGAERGDALAGVARDGRGELDERRVGVGVREALRACIGLAHARQDVDARVRQRPRRALDEDQLLLDADREGRLRTEAHFARGGRAQARPRA
jgi:hypothetical protein